MKKESKKTILLFLIIISIFLILLVPLVSAGLFSDIGELFKKIFGYGKEKIKGEVGELYTTSGTNYGYGYGCDYNLDCDDYDLCTIDSCKNSVCKHNPISENLGQECNSHEDCGGFGELSCNSGKCICNKCTDESDCDYLHPLICQYVDAGCNINFLPEGEKQNAYCEYGEIEKGNTDEYCYQDSIYGNVCNGEGQCVNCVSNEYCDDDNSCTEDICEEDTCLNTEKVCELGRSCNPETGVCNECEENNDCGEDICLEGECETPCLINEDCELNEVCDEEDGICKKACITNDDCEEGETCNEVEGFCTEPCGDGTCDSVSENCNNCPKDCICPQGPEGQEGVCESVVQEGTSSGSIIEYKCCYNSQSEGECECTEEPVKTCDCSCGISFFGTRYRIGCSQEACTKNYCNYQSRYKGLLITCTPDPYYCPVALSSAEPVTISTKFCDINSPCLMWEYPDSEGLYIMKQGETILKDGTDCITPCEKSECCSIKLCKSDQELVLNEETGVKECKCLDPERINLGGVCVCGDGDKILDYNKNCVCRDSNKEEDDYRNCICKDNKKINKEGICVCKNGQSNPDCDFPEVKCNLKKYYTGTCTKSEKETENDCCVPDCEGKLCGHDGCGGDCASSYPKDEYVCEYGVAKVKEFYCYNNQFDFVETERDILMDLVVYNAEPYEAVAPQGNMVFADKGDRVRAEFKTVYADSCTITYPDGLGRGLTETISPAYGTFKEIEVQIQKPGVFAMRCSNEPCTSQPENNINPFISEPPNTKVKAVGITEEKPINHCEMKGFECSLLQDCLCNPAKDQDCPDSEYRRQPDYDGACMHGGENKVCCSKPDTRSSMFLEYMTPEEPGVDPNFVPKTVVDQWVNYNFYYNPDDEKIAAKEVMQSLYDWGVSKDKGGPEKNVVKESYLKKLSKICIPYPNAPGQSKDSNEIDRLQFISKKRCMAYYLAFSSWETVRLPHGGSYFTWPEKVDYTKNWDAYIIPTFNTYIVYLRAPTKVDRNLVQPPQKWYQWPEAVVRMMYPPVAEQEWYPYATVPVLYNLAEAARNREKEMQGKNYLVAGLEFALYMVPFGESTDQVITFGNYKRAGIAAVRDFAGLLTMGTGKAATTFGKVVTGVARTTETGFAVYDAYPSARAIYESPGEAGTLNYVIVAVNAIPIGSNVGFALTKGVRSTGKRGPRVGDDVAKEILEVMDDAHINKRIPRGIAYLNVEEAKRVSAQRKILKELRDSENPKQAYETLLKRFGLENSPPGAKGRFVDQSLVVELTEDFIFDYDDIAHIEKLNSKEWTIEAERLFLKNKAFLEDTFSYDKSIKNLRIPAGAKVRMPDGSLRPLLADIEGVEKEIWGAMAHRGAFEETVHALNTQFGSERFVSNNFLTPNFVEEAHRIIDDDEILEFALGFIDEGEIYFEILLSSSPAMRKRLNPLFMLAYPEIRGAMREFMDDLDPIFLIKRADSFGITVPATRGFTRIDDYTGLAGRARAKRGARELVKSNVDNYASFGYSQADSSAYKVKKRMESQMLEDLIDFSETRTTYFYSGFKEVDVETSFVLRESGISKFFSGPDIKVRELFGLGSQVPETSVKRLARLYKPVNDLKRDNVKKIVYVTSKTEAEEIVGHLGDAVSIRTKMVLDNKNDAGLAARFFDESGELREVIIDFETGDIKNIEAAVVEIDVDKASGIIEGLYNIHGN